MSPPDATNRRFVRWSALAIAAGAVGLTARFWWSVIAPYPRSELTIDWSPLVYGAAGLLASIVALRVLSSAEGSLRAVERRWLQVVSVTCAVGYLVLMFAFFWRSFR